MLRLLGCGCLGLILLGVAGAAAVFFWFAKAQEQLPPEAQAEVLLPANADLIRRIETSIATARTPAEAVTALQAQAWEDRVVQLTVAMPDGRSQEVRRTLAWTSETFLAINGAGAGRVETPQGPRAVLLLTGQQPLAAGGVTLSWRCVLLPSSRSAAPRPDVPVER